MIRLASEIPLTNGEKRRIRARNRRIQRARKFKTETRADIICFCLFFMSFCIMSIWGIMTATTL